ncbi:hypothetical protein O2W14_16520 [Modestobacter sp. VKM Ac-2986]|uniref:hypothetical protein n=1 Tax=Modestobacter sp. VKM Ac-2986 TaxID=3004140 RepID=UPI0022AB6D1C|nr:hypothetical protein [Modestobacter sp. VKM Ac-2986]MCZ2830443.1 hypothetical protein [Modestobacter sp. VKM Ac-2986]
MRRLLLPLAVATALTLTGCTGSDGDTPAGAGEPSAGPTAGPSTAQPEPSAAEAAEAAAATADPATVQDPAGAAVAIALRASDLPAGWTVQANPLGEATDIADNPSLDGICDQRFGSEVHRTSKQPVVAVDPAGAAQLSSEAISYDTAEAASSAVRELVAAFSSCPPDTYTFQPAPSAEGLAEMSVVFQYQLADGTTQVVVAQAVGQVLSVLIGDDPATTTAAGRAIATRMSALPAAAIGR